MVRIFFLMLLISLMSATAAVEFAAAKKASGGNMTEVGVDGVINAPALERRAGQRPPSSNSCQGVDLVIEQVQLKRTSSGMYLQATVKNICTGSSNADGIDIEIDERLIPGGTGGVIQPIGVTRIEPGGTYRNSWVGVMPNPSGLSIYIVKAVLKGGSRRERSSANNSCRATIAIDEDTKTVRCR